MLLVAQAARAEVVLVKVRVEVVVAAVVMVVVVIVVAVLVVLAESVVLTLWGTTVRVVKTVDVVVTVEVDAARVVVLVAAVDTTTTVVLMSIISSPGWRELVSTNDALLGVGGESHIRRCWGISLRDRRQYYRWRISFHAQMGLSRGQDLAFCLGMLWLQWTKWAGSRYL